MPEYPTVLIRRLGQRGRRERHRSPLSTADQEETDRLWSALLQGGGEESQCAWLTDRFGVSWQIVPDVLPRLLGAKDREAAGRAMQAMLKKIDVAALEAVVFKDHGATTFRNNDI